LTKKNLILYIEETLSARFKEIMFHEKSSVSSKVAEWMRAYINEYEGKTDVEQKTTITEYEDLKKRHIKLVAEADKLAKRLAKTKQVDNMKELAEKLGLDVKNFSNLTKLAPEMTEKWKAKGGAEEHIDLFIAYLELVKEKRKAEAELRELRKKMAEAEAKEA